MWRATTLGYYVGRWNGTFQVKGKFKFGKVPVRTNRLWSELDTQAIFQISTIWPE